MADGDCVGVLRKLPNVLLGWLVDCNLLVAWLVDRNLLVAWLVDRNLLVAWLVDRNFLVAWLVDRNLLVDLNLLVAWLVDRVAIVCLDVGCIVALVFTSYCRQPSVHSRRAAIASMGRHDYSVSHARL